MNSKGQAALEYLLLLVVVASVALAVYKNLSKYMLNAPDSYFNKSISFFESTFNADSGNLRGAYKRFALPK